jgi:hypothetical protein
MPKFYTYDQVVKLIANLMEITTGEGEAEAREFVNAFPVCNAPGCTELAEWEGWDKCSPLMHKIHVCDGHKNLLRGYKGE